MTKRDYELAAEIAQQYASPNADVLTEAYAVGQAVVDAFALLFLKDGNPRFDESRFRLACVPSNNVKARPRKAKVAA